MSIDAINRQHCKGWVTVGVRSSFPTPAETLVELNRRQKLIQLRRDQVELGGKIVGFIGEHFEIACHATAVSHMRQPGGILRRIHQQLLLFTKLLSLALGDQGVGDITKGALDRLLIKEHGFLLLGLGKAALG